MSRSVTINLPDEVFETIQRIAAHNNETMEAVVNEWLLLFADKPFARIQPDDLVHYTDVQLWAIVERRLLWFEIGRFHALMAKARQDDLTASEIGELDELLDEYNHMILVRSVAFRLLKERGYDVDSYADSGISE